MGASARPRSIAAHQGRRSPPHGAIKRSVGFHNQLGLAELVAVLNSPLRIPKPGSIQLLTDIRRSPTVVIYTIDAQREALAWRLWEEGPDKDWSLVDCASFVVMHDLGITETLTTDRHFEQAGFACLPGM